MTHRIVMPLLNKKVTTFKGAPWYFDDKTFLTTIYVEDHGAFFSHSHERYSNEIKTDTKCVYVDSPGFDDVVEFAKSISAKVKFALNNFSSGPTPVLLPYAAYLTVNDKTRKSRVIDVIDLEAVANFHTLRSQAYRIRSGATTEAVSGFYKVVDKACTAHPPVIFTLDRFNTCLTRANQLDQVVDASISLESLIGGTNELSFRFALFHSFITEAEPQKRADAFIHFKNLYAARSAVVHGELKQKGIGKVLDNWDEILRLMRAAINYYLLFLFVRDQKDWNDHLQRLVLGLDKLITEGEVPNG